MRLAVIDALRALSDPRRQASWGRRDGVSFYDDLTMNVQILYDDCQVLPDPSTRVGSVLDDGDVDSLRNVHAALDPVLSELGERPDADYIGDPRWPGVMSAASDAFDAMTQISTEEDMVSRWTTDTLATRVDSADGAESLVLALTRQMPNYAERLAYTLRCPITELWSIFLAATGRTAYIETDPHVGAATVLAVGDARLSGGRTRFGLWRDALNLVVDILGDPEAGYRTGFDARELSAAVDVTFGPA